MKIVYVITGLSMGGAEKQVCLLADKMTERGNQVALISLGRDAKNLPSNSQVSVYQLSMSKQPFSLIKNFLKLRRIVKSIDPDVVHSHLFHANILCRLLRCVINLKLLISSSHSRYEGGRFRMSLYRRTSCFSDLVTNVSCDAVKENVRMKIASPEKILVVPNGIDTDAFKYIPGARKKIIHELGFSDEHIIILAVGRFTEAKDYPGMLKAFEILVKDKGYKNLKLLIAGEGELFNQIFELRKQLQLEPYVTFLGLRNDIPDLMSAADIYMMSSAWEGLPIVIGEAMSCNCLIITTRCGGVAEILGECGTIVPVGSPKQLAEGVLRTLALTENERNDLKNKARARIEDNFSIKKIVDNWSKIYKKS